MRQNARRGPFQPKGTVLMVVVFLLLFLLPVMMTFSKWLTVHRRGTTQARVHIKEFYAARSGRELEWQRINGGVTGWIAWGVGNTDNFVLRVDSGTVVSVAAAHVGTP